MPPGNDPAAQGRHLVEGAATLHRDLSVMYFHLIGMNAIDHGGPDHGRRDRIHRDAVSANSFPADFTNPITPALVAE